MCLASWSSWWGWGSRTRRWRWRCVQRLGRATRLHACLDELPQLVKGVALHDVGNGWAAHALARALQQLHGAKLLHRLGHGFAVDFRSAPCRLAETLAGYG